MLHIALNSAEPGLRGLLRYRPLTARLLSGLTEVLLRGPRIDGEAVDLNPPVRFAITPAALRVRISSRHPGTSPSARLPCRGRLTA
jgi:hypothetical protein